MHQEKSGNPVFSPSSSQVSMTKNFITAVFSISQRTIWSAERARIFMSREPLQKNSPINHFLASLWRRDWRNKKLSDFLVPEHERQTG
jgi:hypothetical protein